MIENRLYFGFRLLVRQCNLMKPPWAEGQYNRHAHKFQVFYRQNYQVSH